MADEATDLGWLLRDELLLDRRGEDSGGDLLETDFKEIDEIVQGLGFQMPSCDRRFKERLNHVKSGSRDRKNARKQIMAFKDSTISQNVTDPTQLALRSRAGKTATDAHQYESLHDFIVRAHRSNSSVYELVAKKSLKKLVANKTPTISKTPSSSQQQKESQMISDDDELDEDEDENFSEGSDDSDDWAECEDFDPESATFERNMELSGNNRPVPTSERMALLRDMTVAAHIPTSMLPMILLMTFIFWVGALPLQGEIPSQGYITTSFDQLATWDAWRLKDDFAELIHKGVQFNLNFDMTGRGSDWEVTMIRVTWFTQAAGICAALVACDCSLKKGVDSARHASDMFRILEWYGLGAAVCWLTILSDNASGARKTSLELNKLLLGDNDEALIMGCDLHILSLFLVRGILHAFGIKPDMHTFHPLVFSEYLPHACTFE